MDTSQLKWWVFDISDWDWGVSLCVVGKTRGVGKGILGNPSVLIVGGYYE